MKRYDVDCIDVYENSEGEWVKHKDVQIIIDQVRKDQDRDTRHACINIMESIVCDDDEYVEIVINKIKGNLRCI